MKILPDNISKSEKATLWLFILVWCQPILVNDLIIFLNKFIGLSYDISLGFINPAIYIIFAILSFQYISSKLRTGDWAFYFIFLAVYFLSFVLHPENEEYLSTLQTVLPFSMLPLYFLGVSSDLQSIKRALYYLSVASILAQFVFFWFVSVSMMTDFHNQDHYMNLAYLTIPYVLYVLWHTFEDPKYYNIVYSIIGVLLIISFGTRGPFLALVFFVSCYFLFFKMREKTLVYKILLLAGGVALYLAFVKFMPALFGYLGDTGGSTRIIGWIMGTDIGAEASSDMRIDIFSLAWSSLKNNHYMGLGFAGDRLFMDGFFVHNIFLELLVSYGLVVGAILCIVLMTRMYKSVYLNNNNDRGVFALLFVSIGFLPLLVSGSYVDDSWFYLMMGYSTQCLRGDVRLDAANISSRSFRMGRFENL